MTTGMPIPSAPGRCDKNQSCPRLHNAWLKMLVPARQRWGHIAGDCSTMYCLAFAVSRNRNVRQFVFVVRLALLLTRRSAVVPHNLRRQDKRSVRVVRSRFRRDSLFCR